MAWVICELIVRGFEFAIFGMIILMACNLVYPDMNDDNPIKIIWTGLTTIDGDDVYEDQ
jgi:hypothetical protein